MDAPQDRKLSVGEMLKRLQEHVLPRVGEMVLATDSWYLMYLVVSGEMGTLRREPKA